MKNRCFAHTKDTTAIRVPRLSLDRAPRNKEIMYMNYNIINMFCKYALFVINYNMLIIP